MRFFFEPRDLWIGLYVSDWEVGVGSYDGTPGMEYQWRRRTFYLCFLPMLGMKWTVYSDDR